MRVIYKYDLLQEQSPFKAGLGGMYNSTVMKRSREAQDAGVDFNDATSVAAFCQAYIATNGIDIENIILRFQNAWNPVEKEATKRLAAMFDTGWDPGEVTALLTLNSRCPYNWRVSRFWIGVQSKSPIVLSLHEIQHFYAHNLLETHFTPTGDFPTFGDFKESLTVLLQPTFGDLLDGADTGYFQHQHQREKIMTAWSERPDMIALATGFGVYAAK